MEIIEIIKWPIVTILVVVVLRKSLAELINGITDFNIGGKNGLSARVKKEATIEKVPEKSSLSKDYYTESNNGHVSFNYSNNNGIYTIFSPSGSRFDTKWSKASDKYIHFYNDPSSIKSIRVAKDINNLNQYPKLDKYDSSSRSRTVGIGEIAIFENNSGDILLVKIKEIRDDTRGDDEDLLSIFYVVLVFLHNIFFANPSIAISFICKSGFL